MARSIAPHSPITLDEYMVSHERLATIVRMALNKQGGITRGEIRKALERAERARKGAFVHETMRAF